MNIHVCLCVLLPTQRGRASRSVLIETRQDANAHTHYLLPSHTELWSHTQTQSPRIETLKQLPFHWHTLPVYTVCVCVCVFEKLLVCLKQKFLHTQQFIRNTQRSLGRLFALETCWCWCIWWFLQICLEHHKDFPLDSHLEMRPQMFTELFETFILTRGSLSCRKSCWTVTMRRWRCSETIIR